MVWNSDVLRRQERHWYDLEEDMIARGRIVSFIDCVNDKGELQRSISGVFRNVLAL